jgi:hypothetical protein
MKNRNFHSAGQRISSTVNSFKFWNILIN